MPETTIVTAPAATTSTPARTTTVAASETTVRTSSVPSQTTAITTSVTIPSETSLPETEHTAVPESVISNENESVSETTAASSEMSDTDVSEDTAASEDMTDNSTDSTESISSLPPETTSVSEITSTEISSNSEQTEITTTEAVGTPVTAYSIEPQQIIMPAMLVGLGCTALAMSKYNKAKKSKKTGENARDKDAARLAEKNNSKKKKKEGKEKKEKTNLSKKVLDTIPYKKILADNIWFLGKKMYSKAYTFDDINFNLADEEQQYIYLERYIEFMNVLDDTVDCQICLWNSKINIEEFRHRTLMKQRSDEFFNLRFEYNTRVLEENIKKGQNAIQKHMYITLTIKAPDEETAARKFKSLDVATVNSFNRIGNTNLRELTSQERVEMLKDFFIGPDESPVPALTDEDYAKGKEKLCFVPDYFDFKKDYFMFNDTYAKTIFIREYPSTATSEIFTDLLATGIEIMITTNIETYDTAAARKLVQHQITAIDTDMAKREVAAAQHGNFSSQMPQRIKNQRDSMVSVFDKITTKDQKLFLTNIQILIKAKSYEELMNNAEVIESTLKRSGCVKGEMAWEQEDGMCDCLPIGYQRKFGWQRTMPSESVAIFMPFNVKEMQMKNAVYYGLNVLSHNIITFDRMTGLINPSGFVLACPGSGKSFLVKREIVDVFLRNPNADILIIDPEREYWKLAEAFNGSVVRFSNGSKSYINPFDFDLALLNEKDDDDDEEQIDVIADKCQLITSFISCMDTKHPLNVQEKAFVDRCVSKAYLKSGVLDTLDPKDMPTLGTFLECMKEETENVNKDMKDKLIMTIDMYVNGSAKYFNNQTNIDTDNRFISYDIRDLNGNLKTQSMLLILDYIWNRLSKNRDLGRATYIYFDEAHLLFADEYALDYLRMLWKRARKYGGVLTGITQNVEDLLKDDKSRSMLSNSEFLALLKQNPTDAAKLQDILHFTDSEIQYVNDTPPGHGILVLGGKDKIPFYDEFPKDTELYSKMTTNFSETAKMLENKQE